MRMVRCIKGKGVFANPTGNIEFSAAWGCVPHVTAAVEPSEDCLGIFFAFYPEVRSVSRYRFVQQRDGDLSLAKAIIEARKKKAA